MRKHESEYEYTRTLRTSPNADAGVNRGGGGGVTIFSGFSSGKTRKSTLTNDCEKYPETLLVKLLRGPPS